MKIKFLIAFIAVATIISCTWFSTKKLQPANPLIGKWKLDSVELGNDSGFAFVLAIFGMEQDSSGISFEFRKDTVLSFTNGRDADTSFYRFDESKNQLLAKDSIENVFNYKKINDSLISLSTKDSAVMFLSKQ